MSVHIFVGPSCSAADVHEHVPNAQLHGPASRGDIYRATCERPKAIALIDGYFEHRLAVWHKELLWALHCGIRVYGASSMGALRAVELAPFGMVGVGHIYGFYCDGTLEADDEVALCHLGPEHGHRAQSEALINIRVTLAAAASEQVISRAAHLQLTLAAQSLFYPERNYASVVRKACVSGLSQADADAFTGWIGIPPRGTDQKRLDSLELLLRVHAELDLPDPPRPDWEFPYTDAWHSFTQQMRAESK